MVSFLFFQFLEKPFWTFRDAKVLNPLAYERDGCHSVCSMKSDKIGYCGIIFVTGTKFNEEEHQTFKKCEMIELSND